MTNIAQYVIRVW